jgi:hypothetical protein
MADFLSSSTPSLALHPRRLLPYTLLSRTPHRPYPFLPQPGGWNYPDSLEVGDIKRGRSMPPCEARAHFSLWYACTILLISVDIRWYPLIYRTSIDINCTFCIHCCTHNCTHAHFATLLPPLLQVYHLQPALPRNEGPVNLRTMPLPTYYVPSTLRTMPLPTYYAPWPTPHHCNFIPSPTSPRHPLHPSLHHSTSPSTTLPLPSPLHLSLRHPFTTPHSPPPYRYRTSPKGTSLS